MLIDDDSDILSVMTRGLSRHNFAVTGFSDPLMALSEFKANQYDMILLDVRMPGMSGFELAKKLWALDPDAKICFFSAFEIQDEEATVVFRNLKTVGFIRKPITPSELARRIAGYLPPRTAT